MKTLICWTAIFALLAQPASAESLLDTDEARASSTTSEYVFRSTSRGNLVPIQILGSIGKPGLYFVPPNTNFVKLLTMAGGPLSTADNESIIVKKSDRTWESMNFGGIKRDGSAFKVDLEHLLKRADHTSLTMSPNDVVFIPNKEGWISQDVFRTISVVSLVMSIVLTGFLIEQKAK